MVTSRTYHALHLGIASRSSDRICYVILPEKLKESEHPWLESMAESHEASFVVISGVNWEEDLTPWKAPGLKGGEFTGKAKYFLDMLKTDLFFNLEASMRIVKPERSILGVSLSGLFAIWASLSMPLFRTVGSVSGSLWYDGFLEWMREHTDTVTKRYYFSLGNKEKDGKNKRLASVEEATLEAVDLLKSVSKEVIFEYNEGNHFGPLIERIEKAIINIMQ
jgi:predicted alpha/beta superfamily hydrolase